MLRLLVPLLTGLMLLGCAQPQMDKPQANGAYLVIDQGQAWAVLVLDGKRIEETGQLIDVQHLSGEHSRIAASYVIETRNCGRLQWLTERDETQQQATRLLALEQERLANCAIAQGLTQRWTALDYSG